MYYICTVSIYVIIRFYRFSIFLVNRWKDFISVRIPLWNNLKRSRHWNDNQPFTKMYAGLNWIKLALFLNLDIHDNFFHPFFYPSTFFLITCTRDGASKIYKIVSAISFGSKTPSGKGPWRTVGSCVFPCNSAATFNISSVKIVPGLIFWKFNIWNNIGILLYFLIVVWIFDTNCYSYFTLFSHQFIADCFW